MSDVTIQASKNGPYVVSGEIVLQDAEKKILPTGDAPIALCRCGASKNKPYCDGTHVKEHFQG